VFQIRCTHRRRHLPVRGRRFSLPQANAQHDRPNGQTKCLAASSDGRIKKVLPCSRLRHGFHRLVGVYGVAGEIRCRGLPRRYHRYAVPSSGSERTFLAQIKSYAKRRPPVLRGASHGTGRRTKNSSKNYEKLKKKKLTRKQRKTRRLLFAAFDKSVFKNVEKMLIATYPGRQSHLSLGVETYRKHHRELINVMLVFCYSFGLSRE